MVDTNVQASLVDTPLVDPSESAIPSEVTSGDDAQVQIDALGTDAQTDGATLKNVKQFNMIPLLCPSFPFTSLEKTFFVLSELKQVLIGKTGIWIEEQSMDTIEQNGTRQLKERRKEILRITKPNWVSCQTAMVLPNVLVCQALKEKIKSAIERSSRRVVERFCDAVPYRPK
ncbi:hypothetical protein H5410_004993 [Solanum commersonii]|uniref:Uncharacterized protein n=1 Tax=Solanum commersonii TaxID=4109 RepID=A0A9J6A6V7_SOLCO|nr:hypothetical protein H5410_004993 [Solanum commersonii]